MTTEQAGPALAGWARIAYEAWATMAPTAFDLIQEAVTFRCWASRPRNGSRT